MFKRIRVRKVHMTVPFREALAIVSAAFEQNSGTAAGTPQHVTRYTIDSILNCVMLSCKRRMVQRCRSDLLVCIAMGRHGSSVINHNKTSPVTVSDIVLSIDVRKEMRKAVQQSHCGTCSDAARNQLYENKMYMQFTTSGLLFSEPPYT